jgi:putative acetyltransferase
MTVIVREMRPDEGRSFIEVRNAAIREIAVKDYAPEVIDSWAGPPVTEVMLESFSVNPDKEIRLVAEIHGKVVGMGAMVVATNELRACYVLPGAMRNGVGSAIVREIERIALENGMTFLQMDSSVTAELFYKALGYEVLEYGQHILQSGHPMACVRMRKLLQFSNVIIRRSSPDEQNSVRTLVQTVADEIFRDLFAPSKVPIGEEDWSLAWVAVSNTKIVGMVLTHKEWISDLWVLPESQGHGVGQRLLAQGESEIASRGHCTFRLRVVKSNARAVQFYFRRGWRVTHEFPHEKFHHAMLEMIKSS